MLSGFGGIRVGRGETTRHRRQREGMDARRFGGGERRSKSKWDGRSFETFPWPNEARERPTRAVHKQRLLLADTASSAGGTLYCKASHRAAAGTFTQALFRSKNNVPLL